jgi:hypothetical protein
MDGEKKNYCSEGGYCLAEITEEENCKNYKRRFVSMSACEFRAWEDSCLSPNALMTPAKNEQSEDRSAGGIIPGTK